VVDAAVIGLTRARLAVRSLAGLLMMRLACTKWKKAIGA
jgi:hypothetical protein